MAIVCRCHFGTQGANAKLIAVLRQDDYRLSPTGTLGLGLSRQDGGPGSGSAASRLSTRQLPLTSRPADHWGNEHPGTACPPNREDKGSAEH